jgi:hypothetical protein
MKVPVASAESRRFPTLSYAEGVTHQNPGHRPGKNGTRKTDTPKALHIKVNRVGKTDTPKALDIKAKATPWGIAREGRFTPKALHQ